MLEEKTEAILKRKSVSLKGASILVGVSGGPDSMALLHYLWERKNSLGMELAAAHVDHMFRGDESLGDALFVKNYCEGRGIPFEMARVNVPELISLTGKNSQEAARDARYGFFREQMEKRRYTFLALAHHGDDQMETILMRLNRGTTGRGRAGIPFMRPFQNGLIIRPFLGSSREEILDYCRRKGIEYRIDPSNQKDVYSRNRFRKTLLPFLKKENPHAHEHFQRFSEEIESDEAYLEELAASRMVTVIKSRERGKVVLDILAFLGMPMPLQRRGIQLILNYLYEGKHDSLAAVHIDQVISLLNRPHPSGKLNFPGGLNVTRSYSECIIHFGRLEKMAFRIEMDHPGKAVLPTGAVVSIELALDAEQGAGPGCSYLPVSEVSFPLIIRTKENGDRMTLKGMEGTRKLKDIFIDNKVPVSERETWPVIMDSAGRIVWLPGLKKSALDSAGNPRDGYLKLLYNKKPTSGGHM
ncbi:tRNA lysidine(34) synthetase TilS [Neobacillus piezotolerans]|uniref:tRNA(Ile)-lysidine synthase n=1 Tax=Neobacillus piezotolerans TaxID=2259171 RepID=A0A3D8GK02_9BACI|nr:tRNA lysidine(34) synthetase TilS [Neobacillus piezotolerans]RDU34785.1 tRNA lysidine(34) synthetase TilS [Neobacillus piezotolerans]